MGATVVAVSSMAEASPAHRAVRPSWRCEVDGEPWPCVGARHALRQLFGSDHTGLQQHLVRLLIAAEGDLVGVPVHLLYRRFVWWSLATGETCRVCGSPRHAVLPGVPPRVVPCGTLHELMDGDKS